MASLADVWDETGWFTDRIRLNQYAISLAVREYGVIHGLAFELPSLEAHFSWTCEAGGVEEGYFNLASLTSSLRFPLPRSILKILGEYRIAPS